MSLGALDLSILGLPLLAGLLVTLTHVPLGREVLARGIIFIDLAVAQVAGLGVIAAEVVGGAHEGIAVQAVAFGFALAAALALYGVERRWPQVQEALIGTGFVLAASLAILLLAANPHGAEHLKDLLVGQILWVGPGQLIAVGLLYAGVLVLWFALRGRYGFVFYVAFALTVTASVQLVGVYLVFASLIVPALAVRLAPRRALLWGYALSLAAYALGLAGSALFDLPAGALIVWMLAVLALPAALLLRPRAGLSAEG